MQKKIAIVVAVLCFAAAGLIIARNVFRHPAGAESLGAGEKTWMQCNARDCGAAYEMEKKEYFMQVEQRRRTNPRLENLPTAPPITCQKCGKETAWRAVKCEKCGCLFLYGLRQGKQFDYADRCPTCGHSELERSRNAGR
jgi:predicted RNA-binding Zn-ribbon protein involved in translation (DUF1610 family)